MKAGNREPEAGSRKALGAARDERFNADVALRLPAPGSRLPFAE
jgi:hypothetical protein